jgi:hypothetical protein
MSKIKRKRIFGITMKEYEVRRIKMKWISQNLKVLQIDGYGNKTFVNEEWLEYVIMNDFVDIRPVSILHSLGWSPEEIRFWIIYFLERAQGTRQEIAAALLHEARYVQSEAI